MALSKAIARQYAKPVPRQTLSVSSPAIPLLESGDRLTRAEFERRYNAMPPHIRAELIEGVVYMSSPVRHRHHGRPHSRMNYLFVHYAEHTLGVDCSDNATVQLDFNNEPQPDIVLFVESDYDGRASVSAEDYLTGSPELVVEIAASTASIDLHSKLEAYRRNGVLEYLVWRVEDNELDWFQWVDERYERLAPDNKGIIRSQVFPGLWLNVAALQNRDIPGAMKTLQQGLASKEHAAFVRALKRRAKAKR